MAIRVAPSPIGSFGMGLLQGYLQRVQQQQLLEQQQRQRQEEWRKQLLDRALSVLDRLPTNAKFAVIGGLAKYGILDEQALEQIKKEIIENEVWERRERAANIVNRIREMVENAPPGLKATVWTWTLQDVLGMKIDKEFVESIAKELRNQGFVRTATRLAEIGPNLAKLPPSVQVRLIAEVFKQVGMNPDDQFTKSIYNEIMERDALPRVQEALRVLRDPNAPEAAKIIAYGIIQETGKVAPTLAPTIANVLERTPATEIGILTAPQGVERWRRLAVQEFDQLVSEMIRRGMPAEQAMQQGAAYVRYKFGPVFGAHYPIETPSQAELRRSQALLARRRAESPLGGLSPQFIFRLFSGELETESELESIREIEKSTQEALDFLAAARAATKPEDVNRLINRALKGLEDPNTSPFMKEIYRMYLPILPEIPHSMERRAAIEEDYAQMFENRIRAMQRRQRLEARLRGIRGGKGILGQGLQQGSQAIPLPPPPKPEPAPKASPTPPPPPPVPKLEPEKVLVPGVELPGVRRRKQK